MTKPLVSVIVPVYNVASYFLECFASLTNQTYKKLEIILIDDGSTDASGSLCERFAQSDSRVVLKHQKNGGLSNARNTALSIARGDYIFFLDADDFLTNDCIEYLMGLTKKSHSPIAICPHYERRGPNNLRDFNKDSLSDTEFSVEQALKNMLLEKGFNLQIAPKLFKRELFEQTPKIRFPENEIHEDVATTYRLFLRAYQKSPDATIAFGATPKYYYNIRSTSYTNSGFNQQKLALITRTDEMCDTLEKAFPSLKDTTNLRRLHARFSILRQTTQVPHKTDKIKQLEDELISYIKEHQDWITHNRLATKRDKLALITLRLGKTPFKLSWRLYEMFIK